jgi:hypothetical protein
MKADTPASVADRLVQEIENYSVIELHEPIQPTVAVGDYDAVCLSVSSVELKSWKRKAWFFGFQIKEIGPANGVLLEGFVNLGPLDSKNDTASGSSVKRKRETKLLRWWRIICAFDSDCSRKYISQRAFKQYLFRVRVSNVETDNRQRSVPEAGRYQKVDEIIAVVSRLGGFHS